MMKDNSFNNTLTQTQNSINQMTVKWHFIGDFDFKCNLLPLVNAILLCTSLYNLHNNLLVGY